MSNPVSSNPSIALGDIVRNSRDAAIPFSYPDSTVCKVNEDGTVNLFRPYVHTGDFSYTGGVICYVGISLTNNVNPKHLMLVQKGQPLK